jgi:hypothetical protein
MSSRDCLLVSECGDERRVSGVMLTDLSLLDVEFVAHIFVRFPVVHLRDELVENVSARAMRPCIP